MHLMHSSKHQAAFHREKRTLAQDQSPSLAHHSRSVNTPTKTNGIGAGKAADLTYWEGAARLIASVATSSKIVVEKSTVPVKTAEAIGKVGCSDTLHGLGTEQITRSRLWNARQDSPSTR